MKPAGPMDVVSVRRLSASRAVDRAAWAAVHGLCCRTGDNGDPIAPERWELFARIWIEPYEKLLPEWTYVAENAATAGASKKTSPAASGNN